MGVEFTVDDALEILTSKDKLAELTKNRGAILLGFLYYLEDNNIRYVIDKIKAASDEKKTEYIKGLIELYPLSSKVLHEVVKNEISIADIQDNILDWFDISNSIQIAINKFTTACSKDESYLNKESELKNILNESERKTMNLRKKIKELNELKKKNADKAAEIAKLEQECTRLERKYSDFAIEQEKLELKNEIEKYKKAEIETTRELHKLRTELEQIKEGKNGNYLKAMEQLTIALKELPGDETDK